MGSRSPKGKGNFRKKVPAHCKVKNQDFAVLRCGRNVLAADSEYLHSSAVAAAHLAHVSDDFIRRYDGW